MSELESLSDKTGNFAAMYQGKIRKTGRACKISKTQANVSLNGQAAENPVKSPREESSKEYNNLDDRILRTSSGKIRLLSPRVRRQTPDKLAKLGSQNPIPSTVSQPTIKRPNKDLVDFGLVSNAAEIS